MKAKQKNSFSPRPLIIGLTGGIATGKSTVAAYFIKRGFPVICADGIVLELSRPGNPIYKAVLKRFGKSMLLPDKTLDRKKIAALVFADAKKLKALEKIIHPAVRREIFLRVKRVLAQARHAVPLLVLDVPLLFENDWQKKCDFTICVAASQKIQIERAKKFRGMSKSETLARIRVQMPIKEKMARADYVVKNTGSLKKLYAQLDRIIGSLENTTKR